MDERSSVRPWHVLLMPAVPALVLWRTNPYEVSTQVPVVLALGSVLVTVLLMAVLARRQRDLRRAALVATGVVLVLSFHGYASSLRSHPPIGIAVAVVAIGLVVVAVRRLTERRLAVGTLLVNVVAATLVVANVGSVAWAQVGRTVERAHGELSPSPVEDRRDVWYIIPDRFAAPATLEAIGVDTAGFADALADRGFVFARDARANHEGTHRSLAATWNATVLDNWVLAAGRRYTTRMLHDSLLGRLVREAGYEYTHLGSWYGPTATANSASRTLTLRGQEEFVAAYSEHTVLSSLQPFLGIGPHESPTGLVHLQRQHALHQFQTLRELAAQEDHEPGSQFVLAHLLLPHAPYIFNEDGTLRTDASPVEPSLEAYGGQLRHLTGELLAIIDTLQARDDPPVIVLLADEGIHPDTVSSTILDWNPRLHKMTEEQRRHKLSILAAVYDPAGQLGPLPDDSTAVDVMRAVMDRTLGTSLAVQ